MIMVLKDETIRRNAIDKLYELSQKYQEAWYCEDFSETELDRIVDDIILVADLLGLYPVIKDAEVTFKEAGGNGNE